MKHITLDGLDSTKEFGLKLGSILKSGDFICLTGDLGAGKTTLSKSIAKGLGVEDDVTSPTFNIISEYKGRENLYHFDVYRILDEEAMYDLGYEEYFYGDGVCIVEWASQIEDLIPEDHLWLDIRLGENIDKREVFISAKGDRSNSIVRELIK